MGLIKSVLLSIGLILVSLPAIVMALPVDSPTAEEIADKAFGQAFVGLQKGTATLKMVITAKDRSPKEKTLSFKAMRNAEGLLRYLVTFTGPAASKGMAFLVQERKGDLPIQYMYIPSAGSPKPVAAGNAKSSFFGSDFIYADLLPYPKEKKDEVTLTKLADSEKDGQDCHVLEIAIKTSESPYGKLLVYVRTKTLVPVQIEFFDKDKKALKTMKVRKLETLEGKLVPSELEMKNLVSGSKTEIFISKINSKAELKETEFLPSAMQQ